MENPIKMDDLEVPLFLETPNSKIGFWDITWLGSKFDLIINESRHNSSINPCVDSPDLCCKHLWTSWSISTFQPFHTNQAEGKTMFWKPPIQSDQKNASCEIKNKTKICLPYPPCLLQGICFLLESNAPQIPCQGTVLPGEVAGFASRIPEMLKGMSFDSIFFSPLKFNSSPVKEDGWTGNQILSILSFWNVKTCWGRARPETTDILL